jgi:hypothetical protein
VKRECQFIFRREQNASDLIIPRCQPNRTKQNKLSTNTEIRHFRAIETIGDINLVLQTASTDRGQIQREKEFDIEYGSGSGLLSFGQTLRTF